MCPPDRPPRRALPPDPLDLLFWHSEGTLLPDEAVDWGVAALAAGLGTPEVRALAGLDRDSAPEAVAQALRAALRSLGAPEPTPERLALRRAAHFCANLMDLPGAERDLPVLCALWERTRHPALATFKVLADDLAAAEALQDASLHREVVSACYAELARWGGQLR